MADGSRQTFLPGPKQYVKLWSRASKNSSKGHWFTYVVGPGRPQESLLPVSKGDASPAVIGPAIWAV